MSTGAKPSFSWVNPRAHWTGGGAAAAAAVYGADDPGTTGAGTITAATAPLITPHPDAPRRTQNNLPGAAAGPAQAPRPTRSPLNPRERLLEVRSRGLPGDLAGYPAISRVTRRSRGPRRRPPAAAHHRPPNNLPGLLDKIHLSSHDASSAQQNPPQLARCKLSLTKSTSVHIVQAHLAQCELR